MPISFKLNPGWANNETFTAQLRLVKMKHVELFTQYRFKATIGPLLKHQSVVALIAMV